MVLRCTALRCTRRGFLCSVARSLVACALGHSAVTEIGATTAITYDAPLWWGTATSSVQAEGASPGDTWYAWERAGRAPASGRGTGFAAHFAEDFARLADLGITHYRLSVNW